MTSLEQMEPAPEPHARKLGYYQLPGAPVRRFFYYRPAFVRDSAPVAVSVHGISRNAAAHAYRLMGEAERCGVPLAAPLFDKQSYGQYQQLVDPRSGVRSDLALLDIIEAAARLSNAAASRILLFGFSGGAQFTHRFVFAHPDRVLSAVHVAAGWYTFPAPDAPYPCGLAPAAKAQDLKFDIEAALCVPQHVMVGEHDIERDATLRRSRSVDQMQGSTRVERAGNWVSAMSMAAREHGRAPTFALLPGVAHDFIEAAENAGLAARVFACFARDAGLRPVR